MVRMCTSMTLACATILVAGSAANAAEVAVKSARIVSNAKVQAHAQTLRQVLPATQGASIFGTGAGRCICDGWDNGVWDDNDGQASHLGGGIPNGAMAADDFYLCEGQVHDLQSVSGFLITNSNPGLRKAKAILWSDCNGCPKDELYVFTEFEIVQPVRDLGNGFFLVEYKFVMANQFEEAERNIVLKGGVYWLSLVGKTDNQCQTMNMCDISFFATTGDGNVKGSVARKIEGLPQTNWNQYSFLSTCGGQYGWNPVDDCCIGCTDLAFTICANPCKILIDNGSQITPQTANGGAPSEKSINNSSRNTRAADDFVVNPCSDFTVCYLEGCIYTNCEGFTGFYEIYNNDCKLPDFYFGDALVSFDDSATKVVDLGFSVTINGVSLRAYRVEFHDLSVLLTKGKTYWISVGAIDTFSFTEKAYFCCNYDCRRLGCLTRFNRGVKLTTAQQGSHPSSPVGWVDAYCDFAFLIAGEYNNIRGGSGNVGTTCMADVDASGDVTVNDLFTFLNAWFTGCP